MGKGIGSYIRKSDKEFVLKIKYCVYCGGTENLHIDHIHPMNKGGNSVRENLTRACNRCNGIKSDALLFDFYERVGVHRTKSYSLCKMYLARLSKMKDRGLSKYLNYEISYCIDKINLHRLNHTYYTKVINSLLNRKYIISENTNCL